MRKVLAFLVMVALLSIGSGAWAKDGAELVGIYTVPGTSFSVRCVKFEHDDAWRHNQTVMATVVTDVDKNGNIVSTLAGHDSASSTGIGNSFMAGGFAGLMQGPGGLVPAAALLRPSTTNVGNSNTNQGNGSTMTQGGQTQQMQQGQFQFQKQKQHQGQGQAQGQANVFTPTNVNTNVNTPINTFTPVNSNILKQGQSTGPLSPVNVF